MTTQRLVISSALLALAIGSTYADDSTLKSLSDSELSEVQGQALMNLTYTDPSKANSSMASQNIGFYKLGMEADVELNANIKKLQLGCGGVNGAGGCDIDIDNLSLSGISDTREGRVGSSAKLTNPFVEFAIKNPNSASTREMMGFRLSAEKVLGMLTLGEENSDKPNGINSLSGYMKIKDTTGVGYTQPRTMSYADTGMKINGNVKACVLFLCPTLGFDSNNYSLNLDSASADIFINGTTVNGRRMNSVQLDGYANINQLNFSGDLNASISILLGLLKLQKKVDGNITGLKADIKVDENLGYIHKLKLNNPFSLSMQKQDIFWNGAAATAQRGWWLAVEDPIDIGNVNPSKKIDITNDVLKQVVNPISNYIQRNPPTCSILDCLFGDSLTVGNVDLPNTRVDFPLKNLQLQNQTFAPNCYGTLKFC
ncbi:hypothetical protein A7P53_15865 [Acinetobacter defluvii]|uniref:hypothetical protein n=1 Tax=Acinetobacter defluvii TaxID=1871111 RepID=UPI00148F683C|nr:hypothetical protein [Acinetobacter defluvii]NNP74130.1 hypothetical protein [Acinetobacter defluvii]